MASKVFIVSTMAGNHNFRYRDEVVGERKKLELQVLSGNVPKCKQPFRNT